MEKKLTNNGPLKELADKHSIYPSEGFEGLPLDFDAAKFYRRFDRFSKNGRQMMEAGRDHGAIVLG